MLTVWRKLWVERDTMEAPDPTDLALSLSINDIFPTPGYPALTTIQTWIVPAGSTDLNNYEEGIVTFHNCPIGDDTFPVVESYPVQDTYPQEIIILGTPEPCAAVATGYTLYDDDDLSVLGTLSNPRFPGGGQLLTSAFEPAYILPVYAGPQHQDVVEFEDYLNSYEIEYGEGSWDDGMDLASTPDFWACLLVGAWEGSDNPFEPARNGDGDPDFCFNLLMPPEPREGAESPVTGATDSDSGKSVVFLQANADDAGCIETTDEVHTVVHEIGHTCGNLGHKDGTIMEEGAPKNQHSFDAEQLNILRNQNPW